MSISSDFLFLSSDRQLLSLLTEFLQYPCSNLLWRIFVFVYIYLREVASLTL